MKNVYACPHCGANLNPSVKIVLVASYRARKGLILLSPLPGNYKFTCDQALAESVDVGAKVKFQCPVCAADLTAPGNQDFAELHLTSSSGTPRRVQFSRRYGTHATFVIDDDEVAAYGDDVDEFPRKNFFGA
jgi:predicted RNA-binding Zn-ribbon protein involved in translation (DUF1610 family)